MIWVLFLILHGTHAEPLDKFDDYEVCSNLAEKLSEAKAEKVIDKVDLDYVCLPLPSDKLIAEVTAEVRDKKLGKIGSYPFFNFFDRYDEEVKVVNFFASWSPQSYHEAPNLQIIKNMGVKIYGIALKDSEANAMQYLEKQNPYSAVKLDETGSIAELFAVNTPSVTLIISETGEILYEHVGPLIGDRFTNDFMSQLGTALSQ